MRYFGFALASVLLSCGFAAAQQAPPAPAPSPLDDALVRWEAAMKKVDTLEASVRHTKADLQFQTSDVYEGVAKFMKPNYFMYHVANVKDKSGRDFEKVIFNGAFGYEYKAKKGEIQVYKVPAPKAGQPAEDSILSLIQGKKADEAKRRYTMKLDNVNDPNWVYINIEPKFAEDAVDFQRAQLLLQKDTMMPRRLFWVEPNKNWQMWELSQLSVPGKVGAADFAKPADPGWKLVDAPSSPSGGSGNALPPRVIRETKP